MAPLSRRDVLALSAAVLAARRPQTPEPAPKPEGLALQELPRRKLGSTGRELPILGLGCFPLGGVADEDEAVALVRRALESGARYFDTAPSYHDGASERRVGLGLKGFARERLFVATKTLERDGDAALAELERSLTRLGLDYVDSVQVHELRSQEDLETVLAKGGVVAALERAREQKKLRHVGVTAHRDPEILALALERHAFATALMPVNPLDLGHLSFIRGALPQARARDMGVVAMKIYAGGALVGEGRKVAPGDLVRFALAQEGVTLAVPGAETIAHWDEARYAAVQPLPDEKEQQRIVEAVGPHQGAKSEWYKRD